MVRPDFRERILDVASDLFYRGGIHATGIDTIIARSEIARMTLYKHFPSKDALIEAVLRRHLETSRQALEALLERPGVAPDERLWLLFDAVDTAVRASGFFGCPFINATAEYSEDSHRFHKIAAEYKRMYRGFVGQIVAAMEIADPAALAAQLCLLIEGTIVSTQIESSRSTTTAARSAAQILVEFHRRSSERPSPHDSSFRPSPSETP